MKNSIIIIIIAISGYASAQQELKYIEEGNKLYNTGQYDKAAGAYRSALDENAESAPANYNLGNALYQQEKTEESLQQYSAVANSSKDPEVRAKAFHNMGNAYLKNKEYEKSVDAYKKALRENPSDLDTKYNLAYAQSMLKQQQQQQDQQQQQQQDDEQEQDQEQQQQDQQQPKNQQDQQQNEQEQNPQQQQPSGKDQPYSKEEMDRIMERLNNDDKEVQDKVNKQKTIASPSRSDKDW